MRLHPHSTVTFHPLKYTSEHIIGREDTGNYIQTNAKGIKTYEAAKSGKNVAELEKLFLDTDTTKFLYELLHQGFIDTIDGKKVHDKKHENYKTIFNNIKPSQASFFFTNFMVTIYLIVIAIGVTIFTINTKYLPVANDFFFTNNLSILLFTAIITSWILIFLHEFGHYIAARSYNLLTRFSISNRYYFIVAITDVTNVYSIKKNDRFRVFFAGMIMDAIIMSICATLLLLADTSYIHIATTSYLFIKFIILTQFFGLMWQFMFFLRTDLYFIIEDLFGIYNMHDKTITWIKNIIKNTKYIYESKKEKIIVWTYALIFTIGIFILSLVFIFYSLPMLFGVIKRVFTNIVIENDPAKFYDAVLFLIMTLSEYVLLITIILKKNLHKSLFKIIAVISLLIGEFFLSTIIIASAAIANSNFVLITGSLCGTLIIMPVHYLWEKIKPTATIKLKLTLLLLTISLISIAAMTMLLTRFYTLKKINSSAIETIIYFILGIMLYFIGIKIIKQISSR